MKQVTREEAISLAESKFWENMSDKEIATFQLHQDKLCIPFGIFHAAVEKALGRPVFTHEFARNLDGLKAELRGEQQAPTFRDIVDMIPKDKRIVIAATE